MKTIKPTEMRAEPAKLDEKVLDGVTIRWLITDKDGANNFAMRYFEMEPGTVIPEHHHPWEHEIFVLKGKCRITEGEKEQIVDAGTAAFIRPNYPHSYKNVGKEKVVFLCLIPYLKK